VERFESKHHFLARTRSSFGTEDVIVIHNEGQPGERRFTVEAHVQPELGFFELDTPIFEGDVVEMTDPRGGARRLGVAKVDLYKSTSLAHTEVKWGSPAAAAPGRARDVYNGPVVIINGDRAQVAWDGGRNSIREEVSPEFKALAVAVSTALELLASSEGLSPDDLTLARDTGSEMLEQMTKSKPDPSKLRPGLAILRGILATVVVAGASGAAGGAIEELLRQLVI
jgi:hypothetical protein